MKIQEIISILEELTPLSYAEDFDNVGLLVGDSSTTVTGILVCHDALEEVIEEAIEKKCNLVVCFHPILFSGLKKITGKDYVQRSVIKAIKNDIAIFGIHTALDNHQNGVNKIFCNLLNLKNTSILIPKKSFILKLTTYVPEEHAATLRNALFKSGAGNIGNYDHCSFTTKGIGSYKGNENSNPVIGEKRELVFGEETKISVTFEKHLKPKILKALFANHPYEEVAYEIIQLENEHQNIGMGMIGELENIMDAKIFLEEVKEKIGTGCIRYSGNLDQKIKKVAVLGGSGSFAIGAAKASGADIYLTADLKYHDFYQSENQIIIADVGHFESERFVKNYIFEFLTEKISTFAIILSNTNTNPVNYL